MIRYKICISSPLPMLFRHQMEKQVLGEVHGNPACWNTECHASKVGCFHFPFGVLPPFLNQKWVFETIEGANDPFPCMPKASVNFSKVLRMDPRKSK